MRGVIFDLGGTLTARVRLAPEDMERANAASLRSWLRDRGFQIDDGVAGAMVAERRARFIQRAAGPEEIRAAEALLPVLGHYGLPTGEEFAAMAERAFFEPELHEMRLLPGALALLDSLARRGVRRGLASNASSHYLITECCRRLGLDRRLDPILSSAAVGYAKPHPAIFEAILNAWDAAPADAVMVGDTLAADIAGARALGMRCILVTGEHAPDEPMPTDALRPDGVAIDLPAVGVILDALMSG
ncbi:MAG TPA: HAD family hydrolase [bacterium]|jgi:putative hydrolase of the HAD superfamily